ncbi:MAG: cyclic nucleotide-binding domain-containing protein [Magnetospirillum sp. WYHS-4]
MTAKPLSAKDLEIVRRNPLFGGLPAETLDALLHESRVVEQPRGKLLFLRGEPANWFFLLLEGWVKVFRDTPDGEQTVIAIMKPGETIAEAAIFFGSDYPASAEVVDNARLVEIPAAPLLNQLRQDPDLGLKLLGALSMRLRRLVRHIEQLQARSTSQRLGDFLLGLCEAEEGPVSLKLPYDKSLIAARLGMKPESLSRALAKLKKLGVSSRGHTVEIDNVATLRDYCEVGGRDD